ncbi:MAG: His/Gly/Thr/Pro-type tRNA ligase C-terminal domain-containing protein, partial [Ignavibacteria bacterium]|nr:His/Gly/Thr/Pro-type tRNA ligase C-terminal domain-containing protein [Ignavibacteria bacterium]
LEYIGSDGQKHRPVVIHRAPFGSLERFIGVLIEHFAGDFPLWLAPYQTVVVPISQNYVHYASEITKILKERGIRTELDERSEKVGYKIRDWETQKVPYMIIVGEKEEQQKVISVRKHKQGDLGTFQIENFLTQLEEEIKNKISNNK